MVSKMVLDRQKLGEVAANWTVAHGELVAAAVTKVCGKDASPGPLIASIGRAIKQASATLVAADEAHTAELADDAEPRRVRDDAASKVIAEVVFAREAIEPAYGAAGLSAVGLADAVSRDPVVVARVAARFVKTCSADAFKMPQRVRKSVSVDLDAMVADVKVALAPLESALKKVSTEESEAQATQAAKNKALDHFDHVFTAGVGVLEGLAVLGGHADLADKLPSLSQRRGGASGATPAPAPSTPPA